MTDRRDAVVSIEVPLCVNDDVLARPHVALGWDSARSARYSEALMAEIAANAGQFDDVLVRAVRLGGGVASNAGRHVADIVRTLRSSLPVADDAAIAMESSVANISGATFPFFRRAGISRFDFEMLSLNSANFPYLNHVDNLADFPVVCDHFLHAYANRSLGVVLAYGFKAAPGTDAVIDQRRSALEAARENVAHVRLARAAGALAAGDEEASAQREAMADALLGRGLAEYAPDCFARAGDEDRFTVLAAADAPIVGFGLGALTRIDGAESRNTVDWDVYLAHSDDYALITESVVAL